MKNEISPFTLQSRVFAFELNNSYWTVSVAFDYYYTILILKQNSTFIMCEEIQYEVKKTARV